MPYITIKNIGPITDTGRLHITPLTLIIGKQSTGKSTLMKILSYCSWFEKRLMIDEDQFLYDYTHYQRFLRDLKKFHRFADEEFSANSVVVYEGECVSLELNGNKKNVKVTKSPSFKEQAHNFKQSFIPAERNFLTAIPNIDRVYRSNSVDNIFNFILEWRTAKSLFTSDKALDVVVTAGMKFYYDKKSDKEVVTLPGNKRISPLYASSGVQSALPIIVMGHYLQSIIGDAEYSVSDFAQNKDLEKFTYRYFKLFIEEPEQNLFPESQYDLLLSLVRLLKKAQGSNIVLTSHSPYILTSINILIKAALAYDTDPVSASDVVAEDLHLPIDAFSAYYVSEDGNVESMIDPETSLIRGEYLDSVSETFDDKIYALNDIIYGID